MSARSTQAARLGYVLAQELGLRHVEIRWSGSKKRGSFGGWRVEWTDGPTVPTMRTLVGQRADRFPAVPVADLGYDRCHTPLAEAIALLLYVDRDRERASDIVIPLVFSAFDAVDWPEQAEPVWHDRARALLRYTPETGESIVTVEAVHALAKEASLGWDNALAWLDRLAAGADAATEAPNVVDLAARRAAHMLAMSQRDHVRAVLENARGELDSVISEVREDLAGLRDAVHEALEMIRSYRWQRDLPAGCTDAQQSSDA